MLCFAIIIIIIIIFVFQLHVQCILYIHLARGMMSMRIPSNALFVLITISNTRSKKG